MTHERLSTCLPVNMVSMVNRIGIARHGECVMKPAITAAILVGCLMGLASRPSFSQTSANKARRDAIKLLLGDPYGKTPAAVSKVIVSQKSVRDTHCQSGKIVWEFIVAVPASKAQPQGVNGHLVLDRMTGKLICAGLPFLS